MYNEYSPKVLNKSDLIVITFKDFNIVEPITNEKKKIPFKELTVLKTTKVLISRLVAKKSHQVPRY